MVHMPVHCRPKLGGALTSKGPDNCNTTNGPLRHPHCRCVAAVLEGSLQPGGSVSAHNAW